MSDTPPESEPIEPGTPGEDVPDEVPGEELPGQPEPQPAGA